ncbi:MFS general substrate transporter [Gyrodon lividus]|nr:MFS general substrate transporter [Gyrodon lividus]
MTPVKMAICGILSSSFGSRAAWRSSVPFVTFVVALGLFVDTLNYSLVISVFPFRLEYLGYQDVSILVGWLLFIYSGSLVLATPVVAMISESLKTRRSIMIAGLFSLLTFQVTLMFSNTFWLMCVGRFFEGISSSVVMTTGLALICDVTPEKDVGSQMGMVMASVPLGTLIGPPVGGALYERMGYKAPFVFGIIFTAVDLVGRVLVDDRRSGSQSSEATIDQVELGREENLEAPPQDPSALEVVPPSADKEQEPQPQLSTPKVFWRLTTSIRPFMAYLVVFCCSLAFLTVDTTLALHTQTVWGLDSTKAGLVFLAAIIPTLISSPLAGWLSDRIGPEWVAALFLFAGIPWWGALTKQFSLVFFVVSFALENFFIGAVVSPLSVELANVTRKMPGIGFAHTYGLFNIVFGIGNTVGSVVGGQIYGHVYNGWSTICYGNIGIIAACLLGVMAYTGETPILQYWIRRKGVADTTESTSQIATQS